MQYMASRLFKSNRSLKEVRNLRLQFLRTLKTSFHVELKRTTNLWEPYS